MKFEQIKKPSSLNWVFFVYCIMSSNTRVLINGVTKETYIENDTDIKSFVYYFPIATIKANINSASDLGRMTRTTPQDYGDVKTVEFSDITDNYGTSDIEAYCDYLALNGFFFEVDELKDIVKSEVDRQLTYLIQSELKGTNKLLTEILFQLKAINE